MIAVVCCLMIFAPNPPQNSAYHIAFDAIYKPLVQKMMDDGPGAQPFHDTLPPADVEPNENDDPDADLPLPEPPPKEPADKPEAKPDGTEAIPLSMQ